MDDVKPDASAATCTSVLRHKSHAAQDIRQATQHVFAQRACWNGAGSSGGLLASAALTPCICLSPTPAASGSQQGPVGSSRLNTGSSWSHPRNRQHATQTMVATHPCHHALQHLPRSQADTKRPPHPQAARRPRHSRPFLADRAFAASPALYSPARAASSA